MRDKFYFFKGRVALHAILKAMGIKLGDEVILPGFTCVVVPNTVIYLGAKPIYVDIDPSTYNIYPEKIEEKIKDKTKVIIVQHTFGIPAEMDRILEIAKQYNLYVVEDCCHAIGSNYKGKEVGTFGDASFFSSQWSKPVTTGLGGWAVINNDQLLESMQRIYSEFIAPSLKETLLLRMQYLAYEKLFKPSLFWFAQDTYRKLSNLGVTIGSSTNDELECRMPGHYEKKMSHWHSHLLQKKLKDIERINGHRRWVVSLYETFLNERGIKTVKLSEDYDPIFLRYPILVKDKWGILTEAKKRRIELGDWFLSPVHPNREGWEKAAYTKGMCLNAERICKQIVNLPTHQKIGIKEGTIIAGFIASFQR